MTWEWSHTPEAYEAVRKNIFRKDRKWLEVVWAEWVTASNRDTRRMPLGATNFDHRTYETALARTKNKMTGYLKEFIWECTEELRNCTNGGWEAHCCPYGCGCHMVPFHTEEEQE